MTEHRLPLRVYYEDTDLAGLVYYANYLKFIERGRSEWVREMGIDQAALKADTGGVFAVSRVVADYIRPAHYDDQLEVVSTIAKMTPARVIFGQTVTRAGERLFHADVTVVFLTSTGRPQKLPKALLDAQDVAKHRA
jgi:acyl-CoA thioester hydrolase